MVLNHPGIDTNYRYELLIFEVLSEKLSESVELVKQIKYIIVMAFNMELDHCNWHFCARKATKKLWVEKPNIAAMNQIFELS